jgi:hypothetical protein
MDVRVERTVRLVHEGKVVCAALVCKPVWMMADGIEETFGCIFWWLPTLILGGMVWL